MQKQRTDRYNLSFCREGRGRSIPDSSLLRKSVKRASGKVFVMKKKRKAGKGSLLKWKGGIEKDEYFFSNPKKLR